MKNSPVVKYVTECAQELQKVVWPTKNQLVQLSLLVIVFTFASAFLLALVDFAFSTAYTYLLDLSLYQ